VPRPTTKWAEHVLQRASTLWSKRRRFLHRSLYRKKKVFFPPQSTHSIYESVFLLTCLHEIKVEEKRRMHIWTQVQQMLKDALFLQKWTTLDRKVCASYYFPTHIAFLFSGKSLISIASNTSSYGHAEMNCMRKAQRSSMYGAKLCQPLKLIVVRINSSGRLCMSRPCYHCGIRLRRMLPRARVYYSDDNGQLQEDVFLNSHHKSMAHRVPSHRVPSHSVPSHSVPSHSVPSDRVPSHSVPSHSVPSHRAPSHRVPSSHVDSSLT
jgi:hypothetical protein